MRGRGARRDDGVAAVELAIVLMVFFALALGAIDFGMAFREQIMLRNAANAGAAYAAVQPCDTAQIRTAMVDELQSESPSIASALPPATTPDQYVTYLKSDLKSPATDCNAAAAVRVTARADYHWLTGDFLVAWVPGLHDMQVSGSEVTRIQGR